MAGGVAMPAQVFMARSRHWTIGQVAGGGGGGGSGCLKLSSEQDGKVIRQLAISKARGSVNDDPSALLSPVSLLRCGVEAPLGVDGSGWPVERNDKLPLGLDAR